MLSLSIIISVAIIISFLMARLTLLIREKSIKEREKITPFECGFTPIKKSRTPFSLRFFIITLIFLIFDIEVSLVLPIGLLIESTSSLTWAATVVIVIVILTWGLLHEWKNGALTWV